MKKLDLKFETNYLDNAEQSALARGLYDFPIVDADCQYLHTPFKDIVKYLDEPYRTRLGYNTIIRGSSTPFIPPDIGDRTIGGRMKSYESFKRTNDTKPEGERLPNEIYPLVKSSMKMAIDYNIVFPTDMLLLGLNPDPEVEIAIAYGCARWMTEEILPSDDSMRTMLYLPFSSPEASLKLIQEFGDKKGVAGFLVTSIRYQPIYNNGYMPIYKSLFKKFIKSDKK